MIRTANLPGALAAIGLLGVVLAALLEPAKLPHGWLAAFALWLQWPLGAMALLLAHALTGGRWGEAAAPGLRLGVASLPLAVPLALPLLIALPALYPWAQPSFQLGNAGYLNPTFFAGRLVLYLVCWLGVALLVLRGPASRFAAPALIVLALSYTFASIDLTMSLDPGFISTIYGMLSAAAAGSLALAAALLVVARGTAPEVLDDLAKLLLALVILWAYLDFMQLLIVWESNLHDDGSWYAVRERGAWASVAAIIEVLHFVIPFALLLVRHLRRSPRAVLAAAIAVIAGEALRQWWTVLPAAHRHIGWVDLACLCTVGGIAAWAAPVLAARLPRARRARHV